MTKTVKADHKRRGSTHNAKRKPRHSPQQINAATLSTVKFLKRSPERVSYLSGQGVGAGQWRMFEQVAVGKIKFGPDGCEFVDPTSLNEISSNLLHLADRGDPDAHQCLRDMAIELIEKGASLVGALREFAVNSLRAATPPKKKRGRGAHENSIRNQIIAHRMEWLISDGFDAETNKGSAGTSASEVISRALHQLYEEQREAGVQRRVRVLSAGAIAAIWKKASGK